MTVLPANVTSLGRLCMGSLEISLRNTWNRNQKSFFIFSESHSDKPTASSVFKFQTEVTSRAIPPRLFQVMAHQLWGTNLPPQRARQATSRDAARVAIKAATHAECAVSTQETSVDINATASLAGLSGCAAVRFIAAIWFNSFVTLTEITDTCAHINACLAHLKVQPNFG